MHETGLAEAIVDAVLRRAAGRRVTGLRVRIGGHPVDPHVVTTGIQLAAAGTEAQDATVELIVEPMSMCCLECGHAGMVDDHLGMVACPRCGGVDIDVAGGEAIVLETITVAEPEPVLLDRQPGGPRP